ncbi:hypothetical protein F511_35480 [Dorcoceras hygrometricum]|uniref:Retrotransposon gag domain-containing protein n=1 Tax=Dorcoceras hygrometricum TaxID=472368 RepID=A0A2Z7DAD5_9LAMI|nr:hypothetical protein F511_35480 [Dorcoceras hygrometricum]
MLPRRFREQQQDDGTPPPPPPPLFMTPFERANVEMLAGITRLLERQSERHGKSHEEDVTERFRKQGPKEFSSTTDPLVAEEWIRSLEIIFAYMGLPDADNVRCAIFMMRGDAALWWGVLKNGFSDHNIQFWKLSRSVRSDRRSEL